MNESEYLRIISGERTDFSATVTRSILRGISLGYGCAILFRNFCYDQGLFRTHHPDVPVISVGNLTTGGTGKTPVTAMLCQLLQTLGRRPGILSRGYRSQGSEGNDEYKVLQLIAPGIPHIQDPDRVQGLQTLLKQPQHLCPEAVVLDDGLQHRRLGRSLNLILVDASCPFGYGYLLPRGLLRESPAGFRRADAVIITRCEQASKNQLDELKARIVSAADHLQDRILQLQFRPAGIRDGKGNTTPVSQLQNVRVWLMSGIGNPEAFRRTCELAGVEIAGSSWFPDHHHFSEAELRQVRTDCENANAEFVLTTVKDLVKIPERPGFRALEIEAAFPEREHQRILEQLLEQKTATRQHS